MQDIFQTVSIALLVLAGLSGLALFVRAVGPGDADLKKAEGRRGTVWGLFLVGLIAGLIILGISRVL
jgi:hypothetical protein